MLETIAMGIEASVSLAERSVVGLTFASGIVVVVDGCLH